MHKCLLNRRRFSDDSSTNRDSDAIGNENATDDTVLPPRMTSRLASSNENNDNCSYINK